MGQSEKSSYFQALKAAGVPLEKHFRNYTEQELAVAYTRAVEGGLIQPPSSEPQPEVLPPPTPIRREAPVASAPDPNEMAGMRLNTHAPDEVIRVDAQGRKWLQEEVQKKGYAAPRGRRVLTYRETGTEETTIQDGQFTETFEIAGRGPGKLSQAKITMPSYQAGIYIDPRYTMFKVHCYAGNEGFDLYDVQNYYGGPELVPESIKRKYVENVLCYDIRTTVMAIQAEARHLQMIGKM